MAISFDPAPDLGELSSYDVAGGYLDEFGYPEPIEGREFVITSDPRSLSPEFVAFQLRSIALRDEREARELEELPLFGSENLLLGEELERDSSVSLDTILETVELDTILECRPTNLGAMSGRMGVSS